MPISNANKTYDSFESIIMFNKFFNRLILPITFFNQRINSVVYRLLKKFIITP